MKNTFFNRIVMSILFIASLNIGNAQQTEIEHNSDTGASGPQLLLMETGDSNDWTRFWLKNSSDATNR